MAVLEYSSTILFYYSYNSLKDKARMHTGMVSRMVNKEGINPELLTFTSDDITWLERELNNCIRDVYQLFHKLSTNINEGVLLKVNVAALPEEPTTTTPPPIDGNTPSLVVYGFWVKNLSGHYKHALQVIDGFVDSLITDLLMKSWWLKCGMGDQYKEAAREAMLHRSAVNNSMYALYKPAITSVTPVWSVSDVTIDSTTLVETVSDTETSTTTTTPENDPLYYDSYSLFPTIGEVDRVYVDRSDGAMYIWNGTGYIINTPSEEEYSVFFYDSNYVVLQHDLGIYSPNVTTYDSDGNAFESIYEPIDVNSGICKWNIACSGKIVAN